ncbi:MAG: hypothetical protein E7644_03380 [Ruminococcaceae bacterium]|nr:hypothetical protein [Oscillospiraceae bacterium]
MCDEKLKELQELEATLDCFLRAGMSMDQKIKVLENSFWRAHHAGYCDYMAGQRMAGVEDEQVQQHDMDCKYKYEVERLLTLLHEQKHEEWEARWQKAGDLFDEDQEKGYQAWLALSEEGCGHASHSIGWCFRNGHAREKNVEKSEEFYRLAVSQGYANAYNGLYWLYKENGKPGALDFALQGARLNAVGCYDALAGECGAGNAFGGNSRVAAYLATRAYELDKDYGTTLGMYYLNGSFLPVVYPYAKYCFEHSCMTKEELEGYGVEFPQDWDEIEPIEPKYPSFNLTLDTCEGATDPDALLDRARELMFAEEPDREAAKPLVLEAARAGSSLAMYYTFILSMDGCEDFLVRGADEYGDLNCIDVLAEMFASNATYRIGDPYLNLAVRYWNMRKRLHGTVPMSEELAECYERYSKGLDAALGRVTYEYDPCCNAVLLRADGSYERIKVDFDTLEGLYAPLGCDRINIISTESVRNISEMLGFTVVMYCDERGMQKRLPENGQAALMSGYDVIFGNVVICGFKKDYVPLYKHEVEAVCKMLDVDREGRA